MALIATGIAAKLLATSTITALVGNSVLPQVASLTEKQYPMVVYKVEDVTTTKTYGDVNPLTSCRAVIACIGLTYADADALVNAVALALDGSSGTWGDVIVQGCFLDDDGISDEIVNDPNSEAIGYYVRTAEFLVWFNNT